MDIKFIDSLKLFINNIPDDIFIKKNDKNIPNKGIIICGGDKQFITILLNIKNLIYYNPNIYIEWYYVSNELYQYQIKLINNIKNVKLIDCMKVIPEWFPLTIKEKHVKGYMIKSYALMVTELTEILLLDSDNISLSDPTILFNNQDYQLYHNIFWSDFLFDTNSYMFTNHLLTNKDIYDKLNINNFLNINNNRLIESGQILINKSKLWKTICVCFYLNYHHEITYKYFFGDKDLYYIAFQFTNQKFIINKYNPYGLSDNNQGFIKGIIQRNPENGNPIFIHYTLSKIDISHNLNEMKYIYLDLDKIVDVKDKYVYIENHTEINIIDLEYQNYFDRLISYHKEILKKLSICDNQYLQIILNNIYEKNQFIYIKDEVLLNRYYQLLHKINKLNNNKLLNDINYLNIKTLFLINNNKYNDAIQLLDKIYKLNKYNKLFYYNLLLLTKKTALINQIQYIKIPNEYQFNIYYILYTHNFITINKLIHLLKSSNHKFNKLICFIFEIINSKRLNQELILYLLYEIIKIENLDIITYNLGYLDYFYNLSFIDNNNKDIKIKISELHRKLFPNLNYISSIIKNKKKNHQNNSTNNDKIKIGFISTNFKNHSVTKDRSGIIKNLDRNKYQVYIFYFNKYDNHIYFRDLWNSESTNILLKNNIELDKHTIENQLLDILVYCDIGMQSITYLLAHMRLAPIQITTWGHSETSGISTIDYYISSKQYEDITIANTHYSENLICQNHLCTYYEDKYYQMIMNINNNNNDKNKNVNIDSILDNNKIYLSCIQYLHKIDKNDIYTFLRILDNNNTQNNDINLIFLNGNNDSISQNNLIKIISNYNLEYLNKVKIISSLSTKLFYKLIQKSYLILDTYPHGGCNTTLESIYFNKLVITLPSNYLRGRFTQGFYNKLNITEGICINRMDYINKVSYFINNPLKLKEIEDKINNNKYLLFNEKESISEWNNILSELYYNYHLTQNDKICIILTCCVKPQNVNDLLMTNYQERLKIYLKSIKQWLEKTNLNIIVVDNSNYQFPELVEYLDKYKSRFEIVSFDITKQNDIQEIMNSKEKGRLEAYSIRYAYYNSNLINKSLFVIKITGRYFIHNFDKFISQYDNIENYKILLQKDNRCEIYGCYKNLVLILFKDFKLEEYSRLEHCLEIRSKYYSNQIKCPYFMIENTITGTTKDNRNFL